MKSQLQKIDLENSHKAIIQRLRISKQKTINTTPFEAHFVGNVTRLYQISPLNLIVKS